MSRRLVLREDEVHVISVTPVGRGLVRPLLASVSAVVVVQWTAHHIAMVRTHHVTSLLILVGPCLVLVATRTWRWRSHKVHLTSERVIVEGGVAHHFATSYELRDVVATRVEQRVHERLARRGVVLLELVTGPTFIGRFRHPAAFCRILERERNNNQRPSLPLDTVFEFEESTPAQYWVNSRHRRSRR